MRKHHDITIDLARLLDTLDAEGLVVGAHGYVKERPVRHVTDDSRQVRDGSLFVAIKGDTHDGHGFISDAINRGATAVMCTQMPDSNSSAVPMIQVSNGRRALGLVCHAFWGHPSHHLRLVGVTGTNGKTTTSWLVHHLLTEVGRTAGLLGTIECRLGTERAPATLTTPAAPALNEALSAMVDAGCTEAAMEVSSHALAQERVAGLRFSVGVFTNLTRDHLDFHGTWTSYLEAKKKLFTELDRTATAIVNSDDPKSDEIVGSSSARCVSYGRQGSPTHRFEILEDRIDGLRISIDGDTRSYRLAGDFNAYNLTAAYSVGVALGFSERAVLDALETAEPVPGRLERFTFDSGVTVIVDFAHTPEALRHALKAVKKTAPVNATLWCIFGCGGDRDPGKRPEMGAIAEALADRVVVTSDNPRHEAPEAILGDIERGMERPEKAEWIADRREAIRFAGRSTTSGDIVLLTGKGHEPYQEIGDDRIHLDDREEVMRWFG